MLLRLVLAAVLALAAGCSVSPLGRRQLILLSDSQLEQQAAAMYQQYRKEVPISKDASVNSYVDCVARAITAQAREGSVPAKWEVTVFQDDSPNAFAVPGGKIGVNTGLLKVAQTQDQLAAVLGHEVAHVLARHSNERASAQTAAQAGAVAVAVTDPRFLGVYGMGTKVGAILPYSRTHEREGDLLGLDLMARAGFDPRQSIVLWQNMQKAGGARPPEFLSTHPAEASRIRDLQERIPQAMPLYEQAQAQGRKPHCK